MNYKIKTYETHRAYLLEDELKIIAKKYIQVEGLSQVRDVFLFSCYTRLSYSDVAKLTSSDIGTGIDNKKWFFTNRTKTGYPSPVPLLPVALTIIEIYRNHLKN
jgi:hypothetical protein